MKKLTACLLCFVLAIVCVIPANAQEEELFAFIQGYAGTERGFVLVLIMSKCVTGVTDAFSVRQQKLKNGTEEFGVDVPPERITVVLPCAESGDRLEVYISDFDMQQCESIRVEGLQTTDGERTLTEQLWSGKSFLYTIDRAWNLGLLDQHWTDRTLELTGEGFDPASIGGTDRQIVCKQGDVLRLQPENTKAAVTIDGDALTRNEDGTFTAKQTGSCAVSAKVRGVISYTWDVSVLTHEEWKEYCVREIGTHPAECMKTWILAAAMLFSLPFPLLTVLFPFAVTLAAVTAPAAYVGFLIWMRFFL